MFLALAFRRPRLDKLGSSKSFSTAHRRHRGPFFPFTGMAFLLRFLFFLSFLLVNASYYSNNTNFYDPLQPHHYSFPRKISRRSCTPSPPPLPNNCFPAVGFNTPSDVPASTDGWWCNLDDEFGFLGFSYEVTSCELPDVSISSFQFINPPFFFLIRPDFDTTTNRFLKHAKDLQQPLRSPLRCMRSGRLLVRLHPLCCHRHN